MSETIRVPDPVYEALTLEAEQQDVSRGAIARQWMEKAEKYDQIEDQHYR